MTWIKICGTTNRDDAVAAVSAGADAVGFVFAPSPRQVEPEAAREIIAALPPTVDRVGVFANQSAELIAQIAQMIGLSVIQLHGDETPEFARKLFRGDKGQARISVFKAITVMPGVEGVLREYVAAKVVDGLLLDSAVLRGGCRGQATELVRGGTGVTFDWKQAAEFLPSIVGHARVILAGGLSPTNVAEAVRIFRPWGVDVCSGVETSPGAKDHRKIRAFVAAVRDLSGSPVGVPSGA